MTRLQLETTIGEFEELHASITARAKSVSVPIHTLNHLLIDHSRMVRVLESMGVGISDNTAATLEQRGRRKIAK